MGIEYIAIKKKELHLTSEELSMKSGVPIGTLNKILSGQTLDPKYETVNALCKALQIDLSELEDGFSSTIPLPSSLSDTENNLLSLFNQVNEEGKEKVIEYVSDLVASGRYSKKNSKDGLVEEA